MLPVKNLILYTIHNTMKSNYAILYYNIIYRNILFIFLYKSYIYIYIYIYIYVIYWYNVCESPLHISGYNKYEYIID